jgi:hypothetical protein
MCSSLSPDITLVCVCDAKAGAKPSSVVDGGALNAITRGFVSESEVLLNRSSVDVSLTEGTGGDSAAEASGFLKKIGGVGGGAGVEVEGGVGDGVEAGSGVGVGSDASAELDTRVGAGLGVSVRVDEGSGVRSVTG